MINNILFTLSIVSIYIYFFICTFTYIYIIPDASSMEYFPTFTPKIAHM